MSALDGAGHGFYDGIGLCNLADVDLVAGIEHCRFDSMAEIYERHSGHVHALAIQLWGTRRADQIVQDVFVQLWQAPASFDPGHGSLGVHLSMQVRLWLAPAGDEEVVERRGHARLNQDRDSRSGLGMLHDRISDRHFRPQSDRTASFADLMSALRLFAEADRLRPVATNTDDGQG